MPLIKTLVDYYSEIMDEQERLINEGIEPKEALKQAILMYEEYVNKGEGK
jgi:hypothetical protein